MSPRLLSCLSFPRVCPLLFLHKSVAFAFPFCLLFVCFLGRWAEGPCCVAAWMNTPLSGDKSTLPPLERWKIERGVKLRGAWEQRILHHPQGAGRVSLEFLCCRNLVLNHRASPGRVSSERRPGAPKPGPAGRSCGQAVALIGLVPKPLLTQCGDPGK